MIFFINHEGKSSIKNTIKMAQLKSMGNGTRKGLTASYHRYMGRFMSYSPGLIVVPFTNLPNILAFHYQLNEN